MATMLNPQSKWHKVTCGDRSLYVHPTKNFSLKAPAEGVGLEKEDPDAARFQWAFTQAEKLDAGLLNPQSAWEKVLCGEEVVYMRKASPEFPTAYSLEAPEEGVKLEKKCPDAVRFQRICMTAKMMDAGLNPQSKWEKVFCGKRTYYYNDDTRVYSLKTPEEGVWQKEEEDDLARFEEDWATAEKTDAGLLNPSSDWSKFTCGEQAYYFNSDANAVTLKAPQEGVRRETKQEAGAFQQTFMTAGKMDTGVINPQSAWTKYFCDKHAYYLKSEVKPPRRTSYSLKVPAEGVRTEVEQDPSEFEKFFDRAQQMDANPLLEWVK